MALSDRWESLGSKFGASVTTQYKDKHIDQLKQDLESLLFSLNLFYAPLSLYVPLEIFDHIHIHLMFHS